MAGRALWLSFHRVSGEGQDRLHRGRDHFGEFTIKVRQVQQSKHRLGGQGGRETKKDRKARCALETEHGSRVV